MITRPRALPGSILVVGTGRACEAALAAVCELHGRDSVRHADTATLAAAEFAAHPPEVVICPAMDGVGCAGATLEQLQSMGLGGVTVIVLAETGAEPDALAAMRLGAKAWVRADKEGLRRLANEITLAARRRRRELEQLDRERLLRRSEARFRTVFDSASQGIVLMDTAGLIVDSNPAFRSLLGYDAEELQGVALNDLTFAEDRRETDSDTFHGGREKRFVRRDGQVVWCRVSGSMVDDSLGSAALAIVLIENVTARREALTTLQRRDRILEAVSRATELLLRPGRWRDGIDQALEIIGRATRCSRSCIVENRVDDDGVLRRSLRYEWVAEGIAPHIENPALRDQPYPMDGSSRYAEVLGRGDVVTGPVREFLPRDREVLEMQGIKSVLVVPIFTGATWWGYLGLADCVEERLWGNTEIEALRLLGRSLGAAIERRLAEHKLRRSEEHFRTLIENATDIIAVVDPTGEVQYGSPSVERTLGYPPEEYLGRAFAEFVHPDDLDLTNAVFDEVLGSIGIVRCVEHRIRHQSGDFVHFQTMAHLIVDYEGRKRVVVNARDITGQKQAEAERKRLEQQVQHSQKLESLGVLAGGIAHDFNNLLTGILGFANLAQAELGPDNPAQESLEQIELVTKRAAGLTKQMLAYSGKGKFVVEAVDVGEVVLDMGHLLEISISKHARLQMEFEPGLPAVEADVSQLRQVVLNLVLNASEAIGEGRDGTIRVSTSSLDCNPDYLAEGYLKEGLPGGRYVVLDVEDSGCGMTPEVLARIFDPFYTTKFTGRGLGLAAVLGIVRGHRGTIHVSSEPDRGTRFRVLLPASARQAAHGKDDATSMDVWRGSGMVLVIDDDQTVRSIAKRMLEKAGFEVYTAANGREGLDLLGAHGTDIKLVLLDLTMPGMTGDEVFHETKRMRPDIPVVLCSGYDLREAVNRLSLKGYSGFLQKPFRMDEVVEAVRSALEIESHDI